MYTAWAHLFKQKINRSLLLAAVPLSFLAGFSRPVAAQTLPAFIATGSPATLTTLVGTYGAGRPAANTLGDVFYVDERLNTAYYIPHGTTTPVAVLTGLSGGRNAYVDTANNVYFNNTYSGNIVKVPYNNGYAVGASASGLATCTTTSTSPCAAFSGGSITNYSTLLGGNYYQPSDMGIDGAGNVYLTEISDSTGTAGEKLLKLVPTISGTSVSYTGSLIVNFGSATTNGTIAVDAVGDVYYNDNANLYKVLAGTTASVKFGTYTTPQGVSVDRFGNVFASDPGNGYQFYEFPAVNGVANTATQYTFAYGYSPNGIAFDGNDHYFYTGYSSNTNVIRNSIFGYDFGTAAIGTSLGTQTFTLTWTGSYTPASIALSSTTPAGFTYAAGSCAAATAYTKGNQCTVTLGYTPSAVGSQRGALVLSDSSGNQIGEVTISGTGTGPQLTADPGTLSAIGSGWKTPKGIAVDSTGAIYVADSAMGTVTKFASSTTATGTTLGSGFTAPTAVRVDAAGNVYIAATSNTTSTAVIVKVPDVGGTQTTASQSTLYTGNAKAVITGLALDRLGNLFVADSGNAQVLEIGSAGGAPNASYVRTVGSGWKSPSGIASDSAGNVYVADSTANTVSEIVASTNAQLTVGSAFSAPTGVAVDASGSVYVADTGNFRLVKIPLEGGSFIAADQYSVGSTVGKPSGVTLDGAANLYVTDSTNATVSLITRTAGQLALGSANLTTTTSQLTAEIGSAGNANLILGSPAYTQSGSPQYFTVTSPSGNGCTNGESLASGTACTLAATFTPTQRGTFTDTLAFSSNALNSSSPTLALTGSGTFIAPTTTTITSSNNTPAYGQPVTITATLGYTLNGAAPTGAITFYLNGAQYQQPVQIANNKASVTFTNLNAGPNTFGASYSGDMNYAASSATTFTLTIAQVTATVSLSISGLTSVAPISAAPGSTLTYTASVTPSTTTAPTGTVSFYSGNMLLGSAGVAQNTNQTTQVTTYTATLSATTAPTGPDVITAVYNGDTNYLKATSAPQTILITPAAFTVTPTTSSITVTSGQSGSTNLVISSFSGYSAVIGLTCSGLPANSACSFNPNNFNLQAGTQTVTAVVVTGQVPPVPMPPVGQLLLPGHRSSGIALALLTMLPLGVLGRRRGWKKMRRGLSSISLLALLALGATSLAGCGNNLSGVTPKGTYQITVTAYGTVGSNTTTFTTTTQTATMTLTVQ